MIESEAISDPQHGLSREIVFSLGAVEEVSTTIDDLTKTENCVRSIRYAFSVLNPAVFVYDSVPNIQL